MDTKKDTQDLISSLTEGLTPVKPVASHMKRSLLWSLFGLVIVIAAIMHLGGFRHDIDDAMHDTAFILESILIIIAAFTATLAAFQLSVPDTKVRNHTTALLSFASAIWGGILIYNLFYVQNLNSAFQEFKAEFLHHCASELCLMVALPTIAIFVMIRKAAPVRFALTGYAAVLAGVSYGALGMRYFCAVDEPTHLFLWHFLPVVVLAAAGVLLGKLLLRWK